MIPSLLLACALLQDPKPESRTVEDRLKELAQRLSVLEKRRQDLSDENAETEKKIADQKAAEERMMRQQAHFWVLRYSKAIGLSEPQSSGLEELKYRWSGEDVQKPATVEVWKAREKVFRETLSAEQVPRLARKVREDQEQSVSGWLGMFARTAKLDPEKTAAVEKAVLGTFSPEDGVLLLEAHPDQLISWRKILSALESSLATLSPPLTEAERAALEEAIKPWKSRRP